MTWCGSSMCRKRDAPANVVPSAPRMPWTIAAAQRSRSEASRSPTRTIPAVEGLKALEGPFQRAHHVEGRRREPFFLYRRPRRARENREKVAPGRERLVFPRKTLQRGREEREGERPGREVERELDRDFGAVVVGEQMHFLRREPVEKGRHLRRFVREGQRFGRVARAPVAPSIETQRAKARGDRGGRRLEETGVCRFPRRLCSRSGPRRDSHTASAWLRPARPLRHGRRCGVRGGA